MRIHPFQGLVPQPALAPEVACVPYDVVNASEAAALAQGKPHSLLHVDRAEIDLPAGTDPYSDAVYAKARVVRVHRKDSNKRYYVLIAGPMATRAQAEAYMQSHRLLAKGWLRTAKSLKAQL